MQTKTKNHHQVPCYKYPSIDNNNKPRESLTIVLLTINMRSNYYLIQYKQRYYKHTKYTQPTSAASAPLHIACLHWDKL